MQKERLAEHLERYHMGAPNAATSRELECAFSIKGIEVRQLVNRLRREGVPIASDSSGYFYAATELEVRATIAHMKHRIGGIAAAIRGLERSLDRFDERQTRLQDSTQSPVQAALRGKGGARERSDASPSGGAEWSGLCSDTEGGDGS